MHTPVKKFNANALIAAKIGRNLEAVVFGEGFL
jgi:hypothetical protein